MSRSTACSALWARCVRPSFIFVMRASGSCGCRHSRFRPFFGRFRSSRVRPPAWASRRPRPAPVASGTPDTSYGQGQQDGRRDPTADRAGSRHCPLASKAFRRFHASMKHMITLEQYQNPRELARIAHFVDTDHHRGDAKRLYPDKTSLIRGFAVPDGGSSRRYSWEAHQGMRRSGAPCRPRARGGSTRSARPPLRAGRGAARRTT